MTYQALYRVWRSQTFDTIIGQQAVTQTLKNAIEQKKTSHAYLFSGPRGTGKTSAAKVFAKAINCEHQKNGEPCNECDNCRSITEGSCSDILEIDAASNNGVDEIRDIRDKVKYAPTQVKYKVYIIDEVHMLSTGAFNALLKTLEEPPEHVVFILATTEPHKIPATIISRTQRFDFKRISIQDIVGHLRDILESLSIDYEEQALFAIARAAEGGMRDSLSILDQAISFSNGKITLDAAIEVTGSLSDEALAAYLSLCFSGETEQAMEQIEKVLDSGKDATRFLENILLYCRDLLMAQQAPGFLEQQKGFVDQSLLDLAQKTAPETIYQAIQLLSETQKELRFSNHANIYLEVVTVKLSTQLGQQSSLLLSSTDNESDSLAAQKPVLEQQEIDVLNQMKQQIQQLEKELHEIKSKGVTVSNGQGSHQPSKSHSQAAPKKNTFRIPREQVYQVLQEATKAHLRTIKNIWDDLLQLLPVTHRAMLKSSDVVAASEQGMVVAFDYEILCQRATNNQELQENVKNGLQRLAQLEPKMVCIPMESWGEIRQSYLANHSAGNNEATHDRFEGEQESLDQQEHADEEQQVVEEAVKLFGEEMVEVTND